MLARCRELFVNLTTRASHSALTSIFCANFFTRATDFIDKEELLVSYKKLRWNLISEKKIWLFFRYQTFNAFIAWEPE